MWPRPAILCTPDAPVGGEGHSMPTAAIGPATAATASTIGEPDGTVIGRYKILQRIGEGGFGIVYMAQQTEPVRRRVALKIIKPGMDTKQVVGRFEAERQALAMMDHPNIARVLDGGATPTGRPFFVMELVRGEPLNAFCDREMLDTRQRIELVRQVALAVQHAHSKGVIHRDLKPSNVLVELTDGKPVPKVIDFGIAKAASIDLTDRTIFTDFRQLIGTPEYMSPEQAGGGVDVDTRTDVFSLGVILYELLTGTTPLDPKKLRSVSYGELQRMIREDEPPTPSQRFTSTVTQNEVAARRRAQPAQLKSLLRGELDWIVMKCLDKERARRYQTANEFVDDLDRYLTGKPVLAAPPSTAYRLRKFVSRNKAAVVGGVLVAAVLLLGIIGTSVGLIRAGRERARLERASGFLERLVLGGKGGEELTAEQADALRAEAATLFPGKPIGVAVLLARADLLLQQTQWEAAAGVLRQAVKDLRTQNNAQLLGATLTRLGLALQSARKMQESEQVLAEAAEVTLKEFGAGSRQYALAVDTLLQVRAELTSTDPAGWREKTHATFTDALGALSGALGPENLWTLRRRAEHPVWLARWGYADEAAEQFPAVHELLLRTTGVKNSEGWSFMLGYVTFLEGQSKNTEAASLYDDLIDAAEASMGPIHDTTLRARLSQATVLWRAGQRQRAAEALAKFAFAGSTPGVLPSDLFPDVFVSARTAAPEMFEAFPQYTSVAMLLSYRAAQAAREQRPDAYWAWADMAGKAMLDSERYDEAERIAQEYLGALDATKTKSAARQTSALTILGAARLRTGRAKEAEPDLRKAVSLAQRSTLFQDPVRHAPQAWLGECLTRLGKLEEASQLLHGMMFMLAGDVSEADARAAASRMINLYTAWNKLDEVETWKQWLAKRVPVEPKPMVLPRNP